MSQGTDAVAMGWQPNTGFSGFGNWIGYNEGMILYCLGLGAATNPLPASAWSRWTSGYTWATNSGQAYTPFPPLFGFQYSHCWLDFRHIADAYMNSHNSTYFENSRRASLAQVAYCSTAPKTGYSSTIWGLTACDGPPPNGYAARGLPPAGLMMGPLLPLLPVPRCPSRLSTRCRLCALSTAASGFSFGPRTVSATPLTSERGRYDSDELGIDQGPIVIMIENYRTQRVWQLFMQNAEVQRGLQRAGFVSLPFVATNLQAVPAQSAFDLVWNASTGRYYQVEYSPNLFNWAASPGFKLATNSGPFDWLDTGPPVTVSPPMSAPQRFYRVFQLGTP